MLSYLHIALFLSLYLLTSAYAVGRGGPPERWATAIMAMGAILTTALIGPADRRFHQAEYGVALADTAMLIGFVWLALTADRYWPLWIAAIQAVTVLSHLAMILKPVPLPVYYRNTVQLWSYPQLLLLALGTLRHRLRTHPSPAERRIGTIANMLVRTVLREQATKEYGSPGRRSDS